MLLKSSPDEILAPSDAKPSRSARIFLGALFLLLTCYTGTLANAFSARPHIVALVVTVTLCALGLVWKSGREPGAQSCIATAWRRCQKLPPLLLLLLAAWLACDAISTRQSVLPFLSHEVFGFHLWVVLLAALLYGYASRAFACVGNVVSAMLVALDAAIAFGAMQYIFYWTNPQRDTSFRAQHYTLTSFLNDPNQFGHYLVLLFPLALWNAGQSALGWDFKRPLKSLWDSWRVLRPAVMLGFCAATTSRSNWLALALALPLFFVLLKRLRREKISQLVRPFRASLAVGAVLVLCVGIQQRQWMSARLSDTVAPSDLGNVGRGVIFRNTLRLANQRPLFGWGPGTFAVEYPQSFRADQYREPVLQAHNIYLHRLMEEGAPALACWLAFVLFIWLCSLRNAWRARDDAPKADSLDAEKVRPNSCVLFERELLIALLCGVLAYGVCGAFVMPEQMPTMVVHFWATLALISALLWRNDEIRGRAPSFSQSLSRWLVRGVATSGIVLFIWHAPQLWHSLRAHELFDEAMTTTSPVQRVSLLRAARDEFPQQPLYWAQLGMARWELEGEPSARGIANLYRAAAHRAPDDGAWRHNIGALSLIAGDSLNAVRNETQAIRRDPTYSFYYATLADSYALAGDAARSQNQRELARKFNLAPVVNEPLDADPQAAENIYFCRVMGARYRHVVRGCELIKPRGLTMAQALGEGFRPPPPDALGH